MAAELGRVRREVRSVLSSWDCPPSVIDDCVLLCSELVANAVTHAAAGSIGVSLLQAGERLLLEVTDVSAKHPVVRHADPDDEQGRGMFLVQEIAAAWGSCREPNGRKTTWCTLLPPPAGGPPSGA
ncbi:ATP-binding protein [Streptomyces sp. NPDC046831]|uniref:ATP-binding protein n=1 Tax=Streptomyces sp. NPDC046831 TaxID=3154805 RepID=UPI003404186C